MNKDQIYFFANWKMYLDVGYSADLAKVFVEEKKQAKEKITCALFPSTLAMTEVKKEIAGEKLFLGAQNGFWVDKGGYTGEVSMQMLADFGCDYVLIGHSERRHIFEETDEEVNKKMVAALEAGLTPVLCVGETVTERTELQTEEVVERQIRIALDDLPETKNKIFIAYEPVWAIGTGVDCSPIEAAKVHQKIKEICEEILPTAQFVFLYGGSVNGENVVSHLEDENVDGVLVGSASSKPDEVKKIIGRVGEFLNNL